MSDVDLVSTLVTTRRSLSRALLTDALRTPSGEVSLGLVVTLVDVGASDPALATCRPDWTATHDLSLYGAGWITEGPIVVDSQLVRVGKKMMIVESTVYDGHGIDDLESLRDAIDSGTGSESSAVSLAGSGLVTFVRLPGSAASGVDTYDPASWVGKVRHRQPDGPPVGTMYERMGLTVLDAAGGVAELALTPYVSNSIGTINGGAQAVLIEAAAEAMRPGLVARDVQIHYLTQVKAGPARTIGTVLRDGPDHSVVRVAMVDAGNDDRLLSLATVTVQAPPVA
jgi:acyl-coenzyme A thioesterase PaaI-like protein